MTKKKETKSKEMNVEEKQNASAVEVSVLLEQLLSENNVELVFNVSLNLLVQSYCRLCNNNIPVDGELFRCNKFTVGIAPELSQEAKDKMEKEAITIPDLTGDTNEQGK